MFNRTTLITLMLAALALPASAEPQTVPLGAGPGGTYTAPVSIDGGAPKRFIVDLGAGLTVLAPTDDGAAPVAYYTGWRMTGERLDGELYRVSSVGIGPISQHDDLVAHWKGVTDAGVAGMISAREFAQTPVTFDFAARQLIFEDAASLAVRAQTSSAVPLALQDDRGKALTLFADLDFGHGQRGQCLIDTGQFNIQVNKRYMTALGVTVGAAGVLQQDDRIITHLPVVALADAPTIRATDEKVIFRDHLIYDCVIGNNFWGRNTAVTFDIAKRQMYVRRVK